MKRRALVSSLGALLVSAGAAGFAGHLVSKRKAKPSGPARLVSVSPALTETVLALGGGAQLVGVSDYCVLPYGTKLPRVGSSLTPNYEAIARLQPTLILCDGSAGAKRAELSALAPCEFLPWLTLSEVVASTRRVGELIAQPAAGAALADKLQKRLSRQPPPNAPRVLLLLPYSPMSPTDIWFIRRNSLHGAALAAAGARNAVDQDVAGLPRLSVERLLALDPDYVLILPPANASSLSVLPVLNGFKSLAPTLQAVKNDRVRIAWGSESVGPSILQLVDQIEAALW